MLVWSVNQVTRRVPATGMYEYIRTPAGSIMPGTRTVTPPSSRADRASVCLDLSVI